MTGAVSGKGRDPVLVFGPVCRLAKISPKDASGDRPGGDAVDLAPLLRTMWNVSARLHRREEAVMPSDERTPARGEGGVP